MTPKKRVEIALKGGHGDIMPFTMYENKIPQCAAEREMLNRGLRIVNLVDVFKTRMPNVKVTRRVYWEGEKEMTRTGFCLEPLQAIMSGLERQARKNQDLYTTV